MPNEYSDQSILGGMPRRLRSNPLALAVLVSLHERPMHPYEIAHTLRSRAKHESVRLNYGSLYSVVDSLEHRGLIEVRDVVRAGRWPERTIYGITEAGAREMTDWLGELVAVPAKEYPWFGAALSLIAALPPADALAALRERRDTLQSMEADDADQQQTVARMGLPRLCFLEDEYEHALRAAEIAYVEGLIADLERGDLDGLAVWRSRYDVDRPMPPIALARGGDATPRDVHGGTEIEAEHTCSAAPRSPHSDKPADAGAVALTEDEAGPDWR